MKNLPLFMFFAILIFSCTRQETEYELIFPEEEFSLVGKWERQYENGKFYSVDTTHFNFPARYGCPDTIIYNTDSTIEFFSFYSSKNLEYGAQNYMKYFDERHWRDYCEFSLIPELIIQSTHGYYILGESSDNLTLTFNYSLYTKFYIVDVKSEDHICLYQSYPYPDTLNLIKKP